MIAQERHRQIVSQIGHNGSARVSDLARIFDVTEETIRRVLKVLAEQGRPTTGTTLASERLLNPYLRCDLPQVAAAAGLPGADARAVLAEIRRQKDAA